jgi:hypothetical protein
VNHNNPVHVLTGVIIIIIIIIVIITTTTTIIIITLSRTFGFVAPSSLNIKIPN